MRSLIPFRWRCSDCGQVFGMRIDDGGDVVRPIDRLEGEFLAHNCKEFAALKAHQALRGYEGKVVAIDRRSR